MRGFLGAPPNLRDLEIWRDLLGFPGCQRSWELLGSSRAAAATEPEPSPWASPPRAINHLVCPLRAITLSVPSEPCHLGCPLWASPPLSEPPPHVFPQALSPWVSPLSLVTLPRAINPLMCPLSEPCHPLPELWYLTYPLRPLAPGTFQLQGNSSLADRELFNVHGSASPTGFQVFQLFFPHSLRILKPTRT